MCGRGRCGAAATTQDGRRRWFGLPFVALGVEMIIVEVTIVDVAVPSVIRDLVSPRPTSSVCWRRTSSVFAAPLLWGVRYPAMIRLRRNAWAEFVPFLDDDLEIRRVIRSNNAIEIESFGAR